MKIQKHEPPREFAVGAKGLKLKDCAAIELAVDEQVTFSGAGGVEYDVVRKDWGFYATPSLNGRLPKYNLRPCMVQNAKQQYFVLLVEPAKVASFEQYLRDESLELLCWLDKAEVFEVIRHALDGAPK